jgi:hypothetical protein
MGWDRSSRPGGPTAEGNDHRRSRHSRVRAEHVRPCNREWANAARSRYAPLAVRKRKARVAARVPALKADSDYHERAT